MCGRVCGRLEPEMSQMSEQEVQAYLDQHKIQTTVEDAINACVKANAADPCLFCEHVLLRTTRGAALRLKARPRKEAAGVRAGSAGGTRRRA